MAVCDQPDHPRHVDVHEDPKATKIPTAVERIDGIGTELSFAVAERYDTITEIKYATEDYLRRIHDIGPQRARAIKDRFDVSKRVVRMSYDCSKLFLPLSTRFEQLFGDQFGILGGQPKGCIMQLSLRGIPYVLLPERPFDV